MTSQPTQKHTKRESIVVIGSVNMDLVCRTARMPNPGETVLGKDLVFVPGGKGANQAVAAARMGAEVHFIGCVGNDAFGKTLVQSLKNNKIKIEYLKVIKEAATGTAMILVDEMGENSIVVSPGANYKITPRHIEEAADLIKKAKIALFQLEIPLETVEYAIELCHKHGVFTMLDPAPAVTRGLPPPLYRVDLLTPNKSEAEILVGNPDVTREQTAMQLLKKGPGAVILKLGEKGALVYQEGKTQKIPGFKVEAKDSTAAGDAFNGALAFTLSEGRALSEAARFANAAGALCCTQLGAQTSLPFRKDVEIFLEKNR